MSKPVVESDIRELILNAFHGLSKQQQIVAQYLLDHLDDIPFVTVPRIAKSCGVSEATVVRLGKSLGFDGFSGLKSEFADVVRDKVQATSQLPAEMRLESDADTLAVVANMELNNLQAMINDIGRQSFQKTALMLFEADHTFTFGFGISSVLADLASYLFTQVGMRTTTLATRYSSPLEQLVAARESDVLFCFSFPPFSKATIDLAQRAKEANAKVIAVSDSLASPISEHADILIPIRGDNRMFTNAVAAVTVFLNALTTEIALKYGSKAALAVNRIHNILADDPNLIAKKR